MTIEALILCFGAMAAFYGVIRWVKDARNLEPDPWGAEVERVIQDPQTPPLCHHCLLPHATDARFCPECGASVGQYNNYMPFVMIFSQGEVLRAGVNERLRRSFVIFFGYLLYSLVSYLIFVPVYWLYLFANWKKQGGVCESENVGPIARK